MTKRIKAVAAKLEIEPWWAQQRLDLLAQIEAARRKLWQITLEHRINQKGPLK